MSTSFLRTNDFPGGKAAAALLLGGTRAAVNPSLARQGQSESQRQYLKALRAAELEAWRSRGGRIESAASPLHRVRRELRRQAREDAWLFTVVGCIAALALVFAFRDSLDITQQWAGFARFVGQLLG